MSICESHVMLKLLPNISNALEQISVFKITVIEELTVFFLPSIIVFFFFFYFLRITNVQQIVKQQQQKT